MARLVGSVVERLGTLEPFVTSTELAAAAMKPVVLEPA
jgi:hypothetical protein